MNTDAPWPDLDESESRELKIQTKLHQWVIHGLGRRFDDLFDLVADPAFAGMTRAVHARTLLEGPTGTLP